MTSSCSNEELEITGLSGTEQEAPVTESLRANSGDKKDSGAKPGDGIALLLGVICFELSDPMASCNELNDSAVFIGASARTRPKGRRDNNDDDSVENDGNCCELCINVDDAPVITAGAVSGVALSPQLSS